MATIVQPPDLKIQLPLDRVAEFCQQWQIVKLEIFGSALREDFRPDSDLDFLVTYAPDAPWSLIDHIGIERRLSELLNRHVDLVSRRGIERSYNWIRRREILSSAKAIYVA
jgi:predicted nucleotidyltransferase